jgi:hypothetical protein
MLRQSLAPISDFLSPSAHQMAISKKLVMAQMDEFTGLSFFCLSHAGDSTIIAES